MKVYTKTGDKGTTMLIGGERVPKNDPRVETYGSFDELDAYIGLIAALVRENKCVVPENTAEVLDDIRKALFVACAFVACCSTEVSQKLQKPDYDVVVRLESAIDEIEKTLPKQFSLLILGNDVLSSHINIARTVCRRAERCLYAVDNVPEGEFISQLINRLSDYLYVLLRFVMDNNNTAQ